MAVVDNMEVS